ncbi:MAG: 23S rRNA (adenine(2503)-C(2))-methyltransferase RlmN [Clostridiales bacterium]|jgi:23S rRNA (adenine2503-C2)-methyltransferase|nr:23S rRNA (adenine(2503)-C(2))-methyltransferase RlmN [Clostridiales bacterium]
MFNEQLSHDIMKKEDICSMTASELEAFAETLGEESYRGGQIFQWLHKRGAIRFSDMTNLPADFRQKLAEAAEIRFLTPIKRIAAKDSEKLLFKTADGFFAESVRINRGYGAAVCVSSQSGCKMGCRFCASAKSGLSANLTAGEIAAQVYAFERVSTVIVMGMGEPFDNYGATTRFLDVINDKRGMGLGARHVTVSTCGLTDKIIEFAENRSQTNLAVSLHAPNDGVRRMIMPVAARYPMNRLLDACKRYSIMTGRRVTYEYVLIKDLNDGNEHARELALKLRGSLCHVNILKLNDAGNDYKPSDKNVEKRFVSVLERYGVPVTIRKSAGADINAACGQLRAAKL